VIIESVAAASAALSAINGLIQQANETGSGVQQLMGTISDFGEAINEFEVRRKGSTFKPLSQNELLKLAMIKKSYERHWKSVHDLLAMVDPEMLDSFKKAKIEQENARQQHLAMLARRKKQREQLMIQVLVGGLTLLIGGTIAVLAFLIVLEIY
jgi:hypothetical protein|tara:strand:- start:1019 stop:1480 length:462 start_codon:yes stop_codon:yes gene_type:complete